MVMTNLVTTCVILHGGEGEEVVRGELLSQIVVVSDQSRNKAKVTSDLLNAGVLVKEACIVIVE